MKQCILISIVFAALQLSAQKIDISKSWLFQFGDSTQWAKPAYTPTNWNKMDELGYVEALGYNDFSGFAWFRKKVVIPGTLQSKAKEAGAMFLILGGIDDNDQTYFNGTMIGESGTMPPKYVQGFSVFRKYNIPLELVQWDKENTIAVRLFDHLGGGGFYKGPYIILVPSAEMPIPSKQAIANYALGADEAIYQAKVLADASQLTQSSLGYVRLVSNMSGTVTLFCNGQFIGKSTLSKNHIFLLKTSQIKTDVPNELVFYTQKSEPENDIIFSNNQFTNATQTDLLSINLEGEPKKVQSGQPFDVHVKVENKAQQALNGKLRIRITADASNTVMEQELAISLGPNSSQIVKANLKAPMQGAYRIEYTIQSGTSDEIWGYVLKGFVE